MRYYATSEKGTPGLRAIPIEETIHPEEKTFTAEEAHQFMQDLPTEDFQLVPCPCRTRTEKLDIRECRDTFPIAGDECVQCETCMDRCMLEALRLDEEEEKVVVDAEKCIGCGVCAIACPTETLKLHRVDRPEKPFDTDVEWYMTVAQDNNRL